MKQIKQIEERDNGKCEKCENYRYFDESCSIYGDPCFGICECKDFHLSDFWVQKRGY